LAGDGFARQREAIEAYAAAHGIELVHEYEERGVTGTKETMDRPGFIEMMTALMSNGVRTVLIERLDRLSRDLIVQETAIKDFQRQGLIIRSCESREENLMGSANASPLRCQSP
jgi:DNA invertase Pin-like site-specific DNA recombinase